MAVNISQRRASPFAIQARDMIGGQAYQDADGTVYICNRYDEVIAFSLCGNHIVTAGTSQRFIEVNLDVLVSEIE